MNAKPDRLSLLRQREKEIAAKIAGIEQRKKADERKDDTREKILIGAALLADTKSGNTAARPMVNDILKRAIIKDRDKEFLKARGWL